MNRDISNYNEVTTILDTIQKIFDDARNEVQIKHIKELREAALRLHSEAYANIFFLESDTPFNLVEYLNFKLDGLSSSASADKYELVLSESLTADRKRIEFFHLSQ
jgi:hypothetical protein